jgi:hypothetical protein
MNGVTPTNVTVNVTTTAQAWAPPHLPLLRVTPTDSTGTNGLRKALLWIAMLVMMRGALRWGMRRGLLNQRIRAAAALATIVLSAQLWMGCGGAGSSAPPPPAQRRYTVTVNASVAGATHSITLTVLVP